MCYSFFFRFCFPSLPFVCLFLCATTFQVVSIAVTKRNGSSAVLCSSMFCFSELHQVTAICQRKLSCSFGKDKWSQWLQTFLMSSCWPDKIPYSNIFSPRADILQWCFALVVGPSVINSWWLKVSTRNMYVENAGVHGGYMKSSWLCLRCTAWGNVWPLCGFIRVCDM